MIYLFAGDDTNKKNIAYEKFIKNLPKGMEVFFVDKKNFDGVQIESFYSGAGLFFNACAVILKNVFEREEAKDFVLKKIEQMRDSENIFLIIEGKLNKSELDLLKKKKVEVSNFELPKSKKEKFNSFLLANDLERKDKLNLWIHFRQAMDKGVGMEELIGILFWKAKDMILKKDFRKFSEDELKIFSSRLSYLLPEARKQRFDDESAFEQFLLEAF